MISTPEKMEATYIKASPSSGHGFVISIAEYNSVSYISVAGPMLSLGLPNKRGIFVDISQAMVLEPHGLIGTSLRRSASLHDLAYFTTNVSLHLILFAAPSHNLAFQHLNYIHYLTNKVHSFSIYSYYFGPHIPSIGLCS